MQKVVGRPGETSVGQDSGMHSLLPAFSLSSLWGLLGVGTSSFYFHEEWSGLEAISILPGEGLGFLPEAPRGPCYLWDAQAVQVIKGLD